MYGILLPIVKRCRLFVSIVMLCGGMLVLMLVLFLGRNLPDSLLAYTSGQLVAALDRLGPSGRLVYLRLHILDMVYPLVYGLGLSSLMVFFWGVRGGAARAASLLAFLPVLTALMDYTENICIRIVSVLFTQGKTAADIAALHPFAASLSGYATSAKWVCTVLSLASVLAGYVFQAIRRRRVCPCT